MTVTDILEKAQFLIDPNGKGKAVLFGYAIWEEFVELLDEMENAEEIRLCESDESVIG